MEETRPERTDVIMPVRLGIAEFVADPRRNGWTLLVDGVAQSYVDMDRPTHLEFEYLRRVAAVADLAAPRGAAIRALHLGGGALTLPRYLAATRPGSAQRVVERDDLLSEAVNRILPLSGDADVRVWIGGAREAVQGGERGPVAPGAGNRGYDLIVADVYQGARMPVEVATVEFAGHVRSLLADDGLYALNVTDLPGLTQSRIQAATLRAVFADVAVIGAPGMLRGRRFGNTVLAASPRAGGLPLAALATALRNEADRGTLVHGAGLDEFISGARPLTDAAVGAAAGNRDANHDADRDANHDRDGSHDSDAA